MDWVDHAKGICIFFVVMFHVNEVAMEHRDGMTGWLSHVIDFARPFRMPDFFLIAGLFLSASIRRPWRKYIDGKVVHFFYFYVLWMTVNFVVFDLSHSILDTNDSATDILLAYLQRFLDPSGPLWFIHILPIFFIVTRLTRSVPWWVMWTGAAILHDLNIDTGWHVPDEFARRYVYFYSGYVFAGFVFRMGTWVAAHRLFAGGYLAIWGIVNGLLVYAGVSTAPVIGLALGYAGAVTVIFTAVVLSRFSWSSPLRYIGENSIVIYLGELAMSMLVIRLLAGIMIDVGTLALIATVVTVLGCLGLWHVALRTPVRFMYRRPRWLTLE